MPMPNFLIIGAAKSGTSALWKYLAQHPEIYMSPKKEPHFFAYENQIPASNGPMDYTNTAKTDLASYMALFDNVTNEKMYGEAATTSLYLPQSVERIEHYIPDAKFIAILRQPADRAYSSFMHLIRDHREPVTNFREALLLEEERIADHWGFMWHYTKVGYYHDQLKRFYDRFDTNQVRVYLHDEFESQPMTIIKDIFEFLEVDTTFTPDITVRANMSGKQKSKKVEQLTTTLFDRPNPIRFLARRMISAEKRYQFTTNARNKNLDRQLLDEETKAYLTALFKDDIQKLENLIDRDLSHWLIN